MNIFDIRVQRIFIVILLFISFIGALFAFSKTKAIEPSISVIATVEDYNCSVNGCTIKAIDNIYVYYAFLKSGLVVIGQQVNLTCDYGRCSAYPLFYKEEIK